MDMNIGIFGDSYAVAQKEHGNDTLSWVDIVASQYRVTNLSQAGSGLYYMYTKFIENNQKFDKIVFLITNSGRLYIDECKIQQHFVNYEQCEYLYSMAEDLKDKKIIDAIKSYYSYVKQDSFDLFVHDLIIEKIKSIRNDVLFIPCYSENLQSLSNKNCLFQACVIDWAGYNINGNEAHANKRYVDKRHGHMNEPNNRILGEEVLKYLRLGSFNIENCKWIFDESKPLEFYFDKKY
jgi:hypothetical protein